MSGSQFLALWINEKSGVISSQVRPTTRDQLTSGDVFIQTHYSSLNYKDALAITGKGKILKKFPLIPGIDMSGAVVESRSSKFKKGDMVLINGCHLGENLCGGLSQYVQAPSSVVLPLPPSLTPKQAMILGTAGFTAYLSIHQMELNGLNPSKGKVLVTGSSGGVGSLSLYFLKEKSYTTQAWTQRIEMTPWLKNLGVHEVTNIRGKSFKTRPLETETWAGAIDNLGGQALEYILARMKLWSSVASVGLVHGSHVKTTVFPLILRGVRVLGISSNNCPQNLRKTLWNQMALAFKPKLESVVCNEISLHEVSEMAEKMIQGQAQGRTLVNLLNNS